MHINIVTLFPEWFTSPLNTSLLGKSIHSNLIHIDLVNPRSFTLDQHKTTDDRPYGGGPGMVMMLEPIVNVLYTIVQQSQGLGRILLLSASGKPFNQRYAHELAQEKTLTLICGRYEGIDARLEELFTIEPVCVGDVVVNGGEAAAMMLVESTTRLLPGFMGKKTSLDEESFSNGLLEYPHYTRPDIFKDKPVPPVLFSGNHKKIASWRHEQSLKKTFLTRPELLNDAYLSKNDMSFLHTNIHELKQQKLGKNLHCALIHYPVLLKDKTIGATSLTNLDVHDIARIAKTYSLGSFTLVTPIQDQQRIINTIVHHWTDGSGGQSNPDRAEAFKLVYTVSTLQELVETIKTDTGKIPKLIGTTACKYGVYTPNEVKMLLFKEPTILLFGTGHGLAPEILKKCDNVLRPLRWLENYNHLSVRSAVAITIDRILGDIN